MHTILYPVNKLVIGGAEQQLLELVRELDKTRFRPIVAPLYAGGALEPEFRAIPGVEVMDLHRRNKYDPSPLWKIALLIRRRRVRIVQPFLSPATFFGLLPALAFDRTELVVTERCGARHVRGIGYRTYRWVEDQLSRFANTIVPNSLAGETMLIERGLPQSKIRMIYNGINLERLEVNATRVSANRTAAGAGNDGKLIGILASLTPAKGHDTLLRALALVRNDIPDARLAIVGDGPRRAELDDLTRELGIDTDVTFFGYQRGVADFLGSFDLLVSSSRDNEGCSNSLLEAMALGVPVIATDIGGNREIVRDGETGFLVPAGDHAALAGAIARVLQSPSEAGEVANRARDMMQATFSLGRMVKDYALLYDEILGGKTVSVFDADGCVVSLKNRGVSARNRTSSS